MAAIGVNWADVWKPVWNPVWTTVAPEPPPAPEPNRGAGKSRKRRKKYTVEIDGQEHVVESEEAAVALLEQAKEQAQQTADLAISRATAAKRRPVSKILRDARKTLEIPQITAPGLEGLAERVMQDIQSLYQSSMETIEIAALLRRREREEEDDEEILLLIA